MIPKYVCTFLTISMILLSVLALNCEQRTPTPTRPTIVAALEASPTTMASPTHVVWPPLTWYGITPGKTSKQEVLQILGEPNTIKTWDDLESLHYFPEDNFAHTFYRISIRNEVVDTLLVVGENDELGKALTGCVLHHDYKPESEIQHQEGTTTATLELYPRCGVAFIKVATRMIGTWYFVPMTLDKYRSVWGGYYPEDDPVSHPFPGLPDKAGVVAGQTTRHQIVQLYGEPDYREITTDFGFPPDYDRTKGDLEVTYYRVPGTIERTHWVLFIFDGDVVQMTIMNRVVDDSPLYTLGDVVAQYGDPEIVYERPRGRPGLPQVHGPTYRKLCYPTKGFTVEGMGGDKPSLMDEVLYAYRYVPMSVEDYENSWDGFPAPSAPIKWEGFADS